MPINPYDPQIPIDAVVFDCDGTLSHIEGIDELAKINGVGEQVIQLTADAMGRTGINPALYQQRLDLVLPTTQQVAALGDAYLQHTAPDLLTVLRTLTALRKKIYIVSAGLYPAIARFADLLAVEVADIFAVNIYFDAKGNYCDFDRNSPLVYADGKRTIVQQLKQQHQRLVYVGDGLNDYATYDLVTRFIGYGGAFYREQIKSRCQYYISAPSMTPLLPLCLTADEILRLAPAGLTDYHKGLALFEQQ
jgi:phosphoserine phosphatase